MLSDIDSDQHDFPRCGHCGAPLAGRFTLCPACHARPVDSLGARRAPPTTLNVPLDDPQPMPMVAPRLPARKIWNPSSRALTNPYEVAEEPATVAPAHQRLRQPIVLGASVLVVTSAVYLGFIHSNDSSVGTPIAVSGKVQTQKLEPLVVIAQKPATALAQKPASVVAQKPPTVAAQQPAIATAQKPTAVAALRSAPVRSPPIPPPAASPPVPRRVASVEPEAKRNPGSQPGNPPDTPRADVSRHLRAARADLQENNLSATKARLAAAIAVQPDNRDALSMRSTVNAREQQRDALLSLARGCGYIARWTCVSHNAGIALQIDSSSKEAQRLATLAMRESELQIPPPAGPAPDPAPDTRELHNHH
jgi:hypothetical protein